MSLKHIWAPMHGPVERPIDFTGAGLGIYLAETTQRHVYGRRYLTEDGRVFRYARAVADLLSGFGAANIAPQNIGAAIPVAAAVGDRQVTVTIANNDGYAGNGAVAENELIGGYFVSGHGESLVQNRMIVGNTAVAAGGGTCRLTLDGPIANAMTAASSFVEVALNPYRYLSKGAYEYHAFMCVPAVNVLTGRNFWGQTWGPCWITPGGGDPTPGDTVNDRTAYFVGDGSVNFGTALSGGALASEVPHQRAGFCIDTTGAGASAMPLIMLQLSI